MKYWCDKCKAFVSPVQGRFKHPHYPELKSCLVCPKDNYMVYLKEEKELV